jgi:hypothetical protein
VWREDVQTGSRCDGELDERFQRDIHLGSSGADHLGLEGFRKRYKTRALGTQVTSVSVFPYF